MNTIIPLWEPITLPVMGQSARFPVHRIFCVGRNYADHAREMGQAPDREPPFFFTKLPQSILQNGEPLAYPSATTNLHHEIELVVAIGTGGTDIATARARDHIIGYAVGLDMTRRDLQAAAKEKGQPWDMGKSFPGAAPMTAIHPAAALGHPRAGFIRLAVDGEQRQNGDLSQMSWGVEELIARLSQLQPLLPGDLIMTGTPAGVGPVRPGQELLGEIQGMEPLKTRIQA